MPPSPTRITALQRAAELFAFVPIILILCARSDCTERETPTWKAAERASGVESQIRQGGRFTAAATLTAGEATAATAAPKTQATF